MEKQSVNLMRRIGAAGGLLALISSDVPKAMFVRSQEKRIHPGAIMAAARINELLV
jgi:hypothetical protein